MSFYLSKANLFILGNGFDLNLGLKSSFFDFIINKYFDGKVELLINLFSNYKKSENNNALYLFLSIFFKKEKIIHFDNFLDALIKNFFVFAYLWINFEMFVKSYGVLNDLDNCKWSNAETCLKEMVKDKKVVAHCGLNNNPVLHMTLKWYKGIYYNEFQNDECIRYGYNINQCQEIQKYIYGIFNNHSKFIYLLKLSVGHFEKDFNDYLIKLVGKKDDSNEIFNDKLQKYLACLFYHFSESNQTKTFYCLSFNYTKPDHIKIDKIIKAKYPGLHLNVHCHNIHGAIKENCNAEFPSIIFGIDDSEKISGSTEFIKSYKIAKLRSKIGINTHIALPTCGFDVLNIYFYGHSLSKNDYSYFQAIFDKFNLYSNEVILHFIYPCDKNSMNSSHYCNFDDIYNLIHEYGKSFDNEAKGNNLFSKLLLEDRLKIHFINWSELLSKIE